MRRLELGNPRTRPGYVTVDLHPVEKGVVRADAVEFLRRTEERWDVIESYNLLEHLPNPGEFLRLTWERLAPGGRAVIRTDNAEWLPFYIPVVHAYGVGAHASNEYRYRLGSAGAQETRHYMVFAPLHLRNLMEWAGFEEVVVWRDRRTLGARLWGTGVRRELK